MVSCDVDRIPEVGQGIAELDGVTEVYSVTGDADLIAMVRVRDHEHLADVIDRRGDVTLFVAVDPNCDHRLPPLRLYDHR